MTSREREGRGWARLAGRVLSAVLVVACAARATTTAAENKALRWARYDVDLDVRSDGSLRVQETQEFEFLRGSFTWGRREIRLHRLDKVRDISVVEPAGFAESERGAGTPLKFRVEQTSKAVAVRYEFPESRAGTRRTIVLAYVVDGAVRRYPENSVDQVNWTAIPSGNPFPTAESRITLALPEGVRLLRSRVHGAEATPGERPGTFEIQGALRAGQSVEVVFEWPEGFVAGGRPSWQVAADRADRQRAERRAFDEKWGALLDLSFLSGGALLAVGGILFALLSWHAKGRDPEVARIAPVLREPPSDLPPAVAGTLIDERAGLPEVIATLVDLARRGHLSIHETVDEGLVFDTKKHSFERHDCDDSTSHFEARVLATVFGSHSTRSMAEVGMSVQTALSELCADLHAEVARRGFFPTSPSRVRGRWLGAGVLVGLCAFPLFFLIAAQVLGQRGAAFALPIGLAVAGFAIMLVSAWMPRRTLAGAQEAARWKAFRAWLGSLTEFPDHERAAELFDRYLAHAIAFGVDKQWVARFAGVSGRGPEWWVPGSTTAGSHGSGRGAARVPPVAGRAGSGSTGGGPSLSGAAAGMGSSLAACSAGIGAMLGSASTAFAPSSSGGSGGGSGFSGGGGSSGGGSGGGGSSFG